MKAIHFGAGNIGRGFIGQLLNRSGYEICFVDIDEKIIDEINAKKQYKIILADASQQEIIINNVMGINSIKSPEALADAIAKTDLITISVGANILPIIAKTLAKTLKARLSHNKAKLNIFVCENMIGGGKALKEHILSNVSSEVKPDIEKYIAFPSTAVDRIVPFQANADGLTVYVEPFYEWVIDETQVIGNLSKIKGATYVKDIDPYIKRKLFTVNTGHGAIAYIAYYHKISTIKDAMQNPEVLSLVKNVLLETGELLVSSYGFDESQHDGYIKKIINRFKNKHISDDCTRVARQPIRKMGKNERFIKPAIELLSIGKKPTYLAKTIAMMLFYDNQEDSEAQALQESIKGIGVEETIKKYSEIASSSELLKMIIDEYKAL